MGNPEYTVHLLAGCDVCEKLGELAESVLHRHPHPPDDSMLEHRCQHQRKDQLVENVRGVDKVRFKPRAHIRHEMHFVADEGKLVTVEWIEAEGGAMTITHELVEKAP